jgi:uncharacterized protein YqfB (UPF0267 family)
MKEDTKLVNVHSSAIHIENKVGLKSRLAWFYMLYKAYPVLNSQNAFTITIGDLKKAIGYTSKNNSALKTSLEELARTEIQWNLFGKDGHEWGISHLLSECRIKTDSNIIYYEYSSFVKEKLSNPEMYVKINLLVSKNFKSKHSLSLYCLALDYLYIKNNFGEKNISLEDMRKYLGLEDYEYQKAGDLYIHVLKKAEEEINTNSDLNLNIEAIRGERNKLLGFKFRMSIKDEFVDNYKPQKILQKIESKQTNIFEDIEVREIETIKTQSISPELKPKRENIKIENKELKEFFAEYKISINTTTIQNKLIEVKEVFKNIFEDYLIFLMNYTKQELKRTNINNISGFYVSLLKDDNQIDNYIVEMQNKEKEKEKNREKINYLVNIELKKNYDLYSSKEFDNYLIKNIDKLEKTIVEIIKTTTKAGEFFYDLILSKHNNGVIDKTLITESKAGTKGAVISHLKKYQDRLKYKALTFEEWRAKEVTEEEIKEIEKNLI